MASEAGVLSRDGQWKVEAEAWKNNFLGLKVSKLRDQGDHVSVV